MNALVYTRGPLPPAAHGFVVVISLTACKYTPVCGVNTREIDTGTMRCSLAVLCLRARPGRRTETGTRGSCARRRYSVHFIPQSALYTPEICTLYPRSVPRERSRHSSARGDLYNVYVWNQQEILSPDRLVNGSVAVRFASISRSARHLGSVVTLFLSS